MRKVGVVFLGAVVALAMLPAATASAAEDGWVIPSGAEDAQAPGVQAAAGARVLAAQRATLTAANRVAGHPANPAYKIARANIKIEVLGNRSHHLLGTTVTLAANPPGSAYVDLGFGVRQGSTCNVTKWFTEYLPEGSGRVVEFRDFQSNVRPTWQCTVARVAGPDSPYPTYDALVGTLINTYTAPRLAVGKVELLGKNQKRLRLVKGTSVEVDVVVRNTGTGTARNVVVKGKGKRLKVKKSRRVAIEPKRSATVTLTVKLKKGKKKPGRLTLTAAGTGVKKSRKIAVRAVRAPKAPRAGKYRDKSGTVSFYIRKRKIVGWLGHMQTQCGGYGTIPQYTMNSYDFPRVKIPRNGIVQAVKRGSNYTTYLELRAAGNKVTSGVFRYFGPGSCRAVKGFSAKRVGK